MDKAQYYELCEALGTEPIESEIPVEMSDLPYLAQQGVHLYYLLKDVWDPVGGNFMGKDTTNLFKYLDLYDITDKSEQLIIIDIIGIMDRCRSEIIRIKQKAQEPSRT